MGFRVWSMFCLVLACRCLATPLQAQHLQRPLRIITTKDGLPQSFISGLVQDRDGFVWIGTRNGLARYDGLHFMLFRHSSKDSSSLASNLIISLSLDKHNRIWAEHESSNIDCIDPVTETIEHITARPLFRSHRIIFTRMGWMQDGKGNLWCIQKSNGLYKYDWKNNTVSHFTRNINHLPSDTIRGLLEDHLQNIWIITQRGLSRFDPHTGIFKHILFPFEMDFNADPTLDVEVIRMHERKNGEIMFGDRKQLIFYNPHQGAFRKLAMPQYSKLGIHHMQTAPDGYDYLESEGIVYRYSDTQGLLPIGDIGLTTFRSAQSFLIDRSGLIWLGTNAAGIHQIDLAAPFFESHHPLIAFHNDLLHEEFGLAPDQWPLTEGLNASSYPFRSTYDSRHRLWIAFRNKVGYYNEDLKTCITLPEVPGISDPDHPTWGLRGISFAPGGTLWVIGDKDYVGYFDTLQQKWIQFLSLAPMKEVNPNFTLIDMVADNDKLWISSGSGEGLFSIDIRTKKIQQLNQKLHPDLFTTDLLLGLKQDPSRPEILWIGSYEGFMYLNKKTLKGQLFTTDQGLPDNTIYSIQQDNGGYLWLSTNKGLCRFHPVTHKVSIFQTADGLPGNEFNRFHSMKLPDGRLAFGGTDGWALFDPSVIKPDNYQPPIAFTNLKINNAPVSHILDRDLVPSPLNSLKELSLPYSQNSLSFEFAGLEFNQPQKLTYRYQLRGYDNEWIETTSPLAIYTKLPPGHYVFRLNATNTTGQWSSEIRRLNLVIRPPFWRTWWAYFFYVIMLAGFIWLYIKYRLNRERLQQQAFLKEREAAQLKVVDELKTRFFSNITHEFRTPLTLILIPVQRLKSILQQKDLIHWVAAIERNANQLLRLINQLLDFSKLESGTLMIRESRGNVFIAIEEMLRSFYDEAESNGIRLKLTGLPPAVDYWFDADKLEQIVRNLVANALKFSSKGGEVEVIFQMQDALLNTSNHNDIIQPVGSNPGGIFLIVRDKGIGISPDQLPFIFNRFYQIDNVAAGRSAASHPKGSGIGLALVKELVELQGGTIKVVSLEKDPAIWHTRFTVWLPYRPATADEDFAGKASAAAQYAEDNSYPPGQEVFLHGLPVRDAEGTESVSVLLVEDNDELAEFIADSLPKSYTIGRAANGAEGLEKLFENTPDLVISDVLMPVMDGYEFCKKLKNDERTNHIPVILLTAKATFDNRIEGLSLGADDYITKPFHILELQLRINNLLERQRLSREKLRLELSQPGVAGLIPPNTTSESLQEAFLKKLYSFIEEKLDDSSFGVQELASGVGMGRTSLHNKLKALTGMPAGDIIKNYRLKRATQYLKEGYNSSETAYMVGFDSPAYFSKCFKEFYKTTPLEFAQQAQ